MEGGTSDVEKLRETNAAMTQEVKELQVKLMEEQQLREQYVFNCKMVPIHTLQ